MGRYRPNDRYDREKLCEKTWSELHHTDMDHNLPQYKAINHIGISAAPCPYSTQAVKVFDAKTLELEYLYGPLDPYLRIKTLLGTDVIPTLVDHTRPDGKIVYLRTSYRGGWGYECSFDGCTYFLNTGRRYFYI